jgi:uncharacterized membrane protein (UPF0182 family)
MSKKLIWGLFIFIIAYFLIQILSSFYVDFEWFSSYDQLDVFWTLFFTKFNVHAIFSALFIILFLLNFLLIRIIGGRGRIFTQNILDRLQIPFLGTPRRALFILIIVGVVVVGFMMGTGASAYWKEYLIFMNSVPFAGFPRDPIFNMDIGFYVFSLPFYKFLFGWAMFSLIVISLFSLFFHVLNGGISIRNGRIELSLFSRAHLSFLAALIVILHGIGYRISAFQLLFSERGKFFGAGYTDVNAQLLAYNVCMILSFIAAALLLFNIFRRSFKLPLFVLIALIPAYFILGTIYPSLQQRFIVVPNELDKETPFIENNIKFTRIAYDIERVKEKNFANKSNLTYRDIAKNRSTLDNVRLWDWRPLTQTYKQLQELKPYYHFNDVDVDRYIINKNKLAVNLSAREISIKKLASDSQTWTNRQLIYTHGYGLVLNRVDKINYEVKRPEIYYGEHDNPYVITNTSIQPGEFDYPYGNENRYTTYKGSGGIELKSFLKRLLFAISFNDINILISKNISNESRILFRRNIVEIMKNLTPFLEFDSDPYIVLSEGKLYWLIDAYTISDKFPYSTPTEIGRADMNYIRNSVKIVIDAYNGTVDYYIIDKTDPIIKTYSNIFKGLFKDISEMPEDLKAHIRYPEAIFNIQCQILLRYHMTKPNVFYNNEDAWEIPKQIYESSEEYIHSYYLVTTLPGESRSEFILIMPFTPIKKDNMIAFMVAKCDQPDYGEIILYTLPKEKLSYGPMQIEARVNQDTEISKQLTLWGQKGSTVIRGNMLVIPIEESLLFIEPLYLKAETSEMPELKRVILSFADKIVMEENLNASIEKLFYGGSFVSETTTEKDSGMRLKEYANRAYMHLLQAEKFQREGNWSKYGEELKRLRDVLSIMKGMKE